MENGLYVLEGVAAVALVVVSLQYVLITVDRLTRGDTGSQRATELHILRRVQHCLTGVLLLGFYPVLGHELSKVFILVPTVLHAGLDYYRRRINPRYNAWFLRVTGNILRPEEKETRFSASVWFLAGVACVHFLTTRPSVVYLSVLNLSFCDPAASLVGISIPSRKLYGSKSITGSCAAVLTGCLLALGYSWLFSDEVSVLAAAGIAGLAEFLTIPSLDDNFTIPVISASLWELVLSR